MDKIRKEFEAWIVSALGCDVADVSKGDDGVYSSYQTGNLYVAWIASRKAICVELPSTSNGNCFGEIYFPDQITDSLDKAGVSYK